MAPLLFVAVKLMGNMPLVPVGVPPTMPVSLFKVSPFGNAPVSVSVGAG